MTVTGNNILPPRAMQNITLFAQENVVNNMQTYFDFSAGPVVSFLMTKMTCRRIALIGSTLVVLGIFLMPFLPYIPALCVCFGLLTGVVFVLACGHCS